LKGGIAFFALNFMLAEKKKSINDLLRLLWSDYKKNPEKGIKSEDVFKMVEEIAGAEIRESFEKMTSTTEEIDLESICAKAGMKFEWDKTEQAWLGLDAEFAGDRVIIKSTTLDGPAYKAGLNAGDEILAINGMRVLKDRFNDHSKYLKINESYSFTVSRLSTLLNVNVNVGTVPAKLKAIVASDKALLDSLLNPKI
jgi:predicted metalloprotease with PDZ domain